MDSFQKNQHFNLWPVCPVITHWTYTCLSPWALVKITTFDSKCAVCWALSSNITCFWWSQSSNSTFYWWAQSFNSTCSWWALKAPLEPTKNMCYLNLEPTKNMCYQNIEPNKQHILSQKWSFWPFLSESLLPSLNYFIHSIMYAIFYHDSEETFFMSQYL